MNKLIKSYTPEKSILNFIDDSRIRKKLNENIITEVTSFIDNLKSNFKKKKINNKYSWKFKSNNNLSECDIDIPINYIDINNTDNKQVNKSGIFICNKTFRILCIFITSDDDDNIKLIMKNCRDVIKGFKKYYPVKKKLFYSGCDHIIENNIKIKKKRPDGYTGFNWLDGMQRYLHPIKKHQIITYYKRNKNADDEFIIKLLKLYCGLYWLETQHVPNIAQIRLQNSIDCNFPGVFGKELPLRYNPATSVGSSLSFSSIPHVDSSIKLTDSIIWEPDFENKIIPYIFRNSYAKINFLIDKPCMIYQPTKDLHGTVNTGEHNGVGFVNLSKSNLLNKTDYLKNWYNIYN